MKEAGERPRGGRKVMSGCWTGRSPLGMASISMPREYPVDGRSVPRVEAAEARRKERRSSMGAALFEVVQVVVDVDTGEGYVGDAAAREDDESC